MKSELDKNNKIKYKKNKEKEAILQTYQTQKHHKELKEVSSKTCSHKRISLFISYKKASITVETALVLPLFLFVVINLLSILNIIRLYSDVEMEMHQAGKKMAVYAYAYDNIMDNHADIVNLADAIGFDDYYLQETIKERVGKSYLDSSPMVNGKNGISFQKSKIMEEDIIDLVAEYKVKPLISVIGFSKIPLINRCRMRAWTGYDNTQSENLVSGKEQIVFITETGTVYHTSRSCTHLDLTIQRTSMEEVSSLRNENGGKYYLCDICKKTDNAGAIYITEQGDRYHKSAACSGLKRTIISIYLSEVGARAMCLRCQCEKNAAVVVYACTRVQSERKAWLLT
ncbi:MAG: hypothetical protein PHS74_05185 [Lachnospiraceae bacterium]|nr:hypothetical protein [Lachnospiraceae bacterium]